MARAQLFDAEIDPDVDAEAELDALGDELLDTALDEPLLDLELGDAEADQAARSFVALVDGHLLAGARQLLRAREPCRPRADDGDAAPGRGGRRLGDDPAFVPGPVHDRKLDLLDRDGVALVDLEHAGRLAGSRTEASGELREVVRAVELLARLGPPVAIDEVVPVRDQVAERAAAVAKGNAALHAPGALFAQLGEGQRPDELAHVADPLGRRPLRRLRAADVQEGADPSHQAASSDSFVTKPAPPAETGWSR